ncbi:alpha/beta fold hydrolase [Pseudooctadecabacter jejudonensis]|uniref:Carboxylesterase BioH n=1 Tax=Pseudooctadecabacter jejudonensis TaxID=1391910 RepID=A0A1Y5SGV8_9RHOB|nr:alpha/beta hydrolase [Pseudooctadecabacter jejudonensis]SLN40544.1 carboxylesterase BioH [Pseudooctadecabacter jejudonensis]
MTLVFLPGMMCDGRLFQHMPPHLCLSISQHDTVEALAADVLQNAPDTFALAGLSMGGIVAMEIIRQAPDRVTKLALMNTNCEAETDRIKDMRAPQIAKAQAGNLRAVMRDEMKPNYLADGPHRQPVLDLCMDMAIDLGPEVFARQSHALMSRPDQKGTLKSWTKPTLILTGEHDRLCPLHRHTLMAELIPDAQLTVLKNAGHLPPLEQPALTHAALVQWLS